MFTFMYAHIRAIHSSILPRRYMLNTYLQTSISLYALYMFTYLYIHMGPRHVHVFLRPIHICIVRSPYTPYTRLYTSMPICALYTFTYFYAHINVSYFSIHTLYVFTCTCASYLCFSTYIYYHIPKQF